MEQLNYLIAISEEKNITRAAEKLFVSQPALTRYIQKLEKEYGVKLLERTRNSVELTEAGRLYLREKTKIAAIEQNLRQGMKNINKKRISITVGTGQSRAALMLPEATELFLKSHPDVDIGVCVKGELELIPALSHGELDMAFGALGQSGSEMETEYIATELMGVLVPTKLGVVPGSVDPWSTLKNPYLLEPEQLNGHVFIKADAGLGSYLGYNSFLQHYNIKNSSEISCNSAAAIQAMICRGIGYGIGVILADGSNYLDENGQMSVYRCTLPGLFMQRTVLTAFLKSVPKAKLLREYVEAIKKVQKW